MDRLPDFDVTAIVKVGLVTELVASLGTGADAEFVNR